LRLAASGIDGGVQGFEAGYAVHGVGSYTRTYRQSIRKNGAKSLFCFPRPC
jgi:hypothetical protein